MKLSKFNLSLSLLLLISSSFAEAGFSFVKDQPLDSSTKKFAYKKNTSKKPETIELDVENQNNDLIFNLLNRLENLQQEVLELRGLVEIHNFKLGKIKKDKDKQILSLANKISQLEKDTSFVYSQELKELQDMRIANQGIDSRGERDLLRNKNIAKEYRYKNTMDYQLEDETQKIESLAKDIDPLKHEQEYYDKANKLITENKLSKAEIILSDMLKKYPNGALTASAHYWLGEIYLHSDRVSEAQVSFSYVSDNYPRHDKAAESLLKLGIIESTLGEHQRARSLLQEVEKRYPNSSSARLAHVKLRQIASK